MPSKIHAATGPRPAKRPVRLPPGTVKSGRAFLLSETDDNGAPAASKWVSLGPVVHRVSSLHEQSQGLLTRARPSRTEILELWPDNPRLRLSYIGDVKENGETYFVYRLRNVLRFVPATAQPPRFLYMDMAALRIPVLSADEPTPVFSKIGRMPMLRAQKRMALVDHPKEQKATLLVMPVALSAASVDLAGLEAKIAKASDEFASTRATPEFRRWFEGASEEVRNSDGTPKIFFRGQTTGDGSLNARLVLDSFTDSPDVASIYSTSGGNMRPGSNVTPVHIDVKNPLVIPYVSISFYDFLGYLGYWDKTGITHEDSNRVLMYLSRRNRYADEMSAPKKYRSVAGLPAFKYQLKNEEDTDIAIDEEEDAFINFEEMGSILEFGIDTFRKEWEESDRYGGPEYLKRLSLLLSVDTFALVETPAAKRVLTALGYDGVVHLDPFSAEQAAQKVLSKGMDDLVGVEAGDEDYDWEEMNTDYQHWTVRPLDRSQVWPILSDKPMQGNQKLAASSEMEKLNERINGIIELEQTLDSLHGFLDSIDEANDFVDDALTNEVTERLRLADDAIRTAGMVETKVDFLANIKEGMDNAKALLKALKVLHAAVKKAKKSGEDTEAVESSIEEGIIQTQNLIKDIRNA